MSVISSWNKILKIISIILILLVSFITIDYHIGKKLVHYRSTENLKKFNNNKTNIDLTGFSTLKMSGSKVINLYAIQNFTKTNKQIYIFDLLEEDHLFIKGLRPRWFGFSIKNKKIILKNDVSYLKQLLYFIRRFIHLDSLTPQYSEFKTEKDVISQELSYQNSVKYIHIPVTRAVIPNADNINDLLTHFAKIQKQHRVHFHCYVGCGRTSIHMIMYDIFFNAKNVAIDDIVKRNHILGSEDLFNITKWKNGSYSEETLLKRKSFIIKFYNYIKHAYPMQSWNEYIKR